MSHLELTDTTEGVTPVHIHASAVETHTQSGHCEADQTRVMWLWNMFIVVQLWTRIGFLNVSKRRGGKRLKLGPFENGNTKYTGKIPHPCSKKAPLKGCRNVAHRGGRGALEEGSRVGPGVFGVPVAAGQPNAKELEGGKRRQSPHLRFTPSFSPPP